MSVYAEIPENSNLLATELICYHSQKVTDFVVDIVIQGKSTQSAHTVLGYPVERIYSLKMYLTMRTLCLLKPIEGQ